MVSFPLFTNSYLLSNLSSILFLHREYIPFLPTTESVPSGPVDAPSLESVAPDGWWGNHAKELLNAVECITLILRALNDFGCALNTRFAGLCAFSMASMNLYTAYFQNMNLGRSENSPTFAEQKGCP